jgi:mono/diheme cytochrome c family protein
MTGRRRVLVAAGLGGLLAGLGAWAAYREGPAPRVRVPALSPAGQAGRAAFQRSCASCHGDVAQGTPTGPPLVHAIYRPGHHADEAFELAVRRGVRAHHWRFGDMTIRVMGSSGGDLGDAGPVTCAARHDGRYPRK